MRYTRINYDMPRIEPADRSDYILQQILAHPDLPWDWENVSRNPNITMTMTQQHPDLPWALPFL